MKKTIGQKEKGITLIALVITVIVLIILAGVSISMLTGDNGLLTKTESAKITNDRASVKEQIELAVLASRINNDYNASIDTSILDTELKGITGLSIEEKQGKNESLPWTVTVNRFNFRIKEDGTVELNGISLSQTTLKMVEGQDSEIITVTLADGVKGTINWSSSNTDIVTVNPSTGNSTTITLAGTIGTADITASVSGTDYSAKCTVTVRAKEYIGEALNTEKYGYKVTNYNVKTSEMSTDVWRLFYQNEDYTYIITDECIGNYCPSDYYSEYATGADVSTEGRGLNSMVSSLFVETNTWENIRATAWLTDTSDNGMWKDYMNDDALFAIGCPTIELYAASYNNRKNKNESSTMSMAQGLYGYSYYDTREVWDPSDNNGIYSGTGKSVFWLASPCDYTDFTAFTVFTSGYICSDLSSSVNEEYGWGNSVRPVVCIPTSVFDGKYILSNE